MKFECGFGSVEYRVDSQGAVFTGSEKFSISKDSEIDGTAALVSAFVRHLKKDNREHWGKMAPVYVFVEDGDVDRELVRCLMNEGFYVSGTFKLNYYL